MLFEYNLKLRSLFVLFILFRQIVTDSFIVMAKVKNKKNFGLADKVRKKRHVEVTKKVLNPFEVHVNREKFKVLGRKLKHDRGLPGVSRGKAIQKRKETIGAEMKLLNKTNSFVDRRIGEADGRLTGEEKVLARFAAEQARRHNKNNIYNLADDVLTHRGQTLEEIEKFDDPRSSDEEDDDGRRFNTLDRQFVSEGHFGGGILERTDNKDGAKSHKDLIEQLIAESKKRKADKQKLKEQTLDLTEKLDTDWKDLQPMMSRKKAEGEGESLIDKLLSREGRKGEDYDKMMRELRFEKRGTPSDALQSEEKLAKQQREKLEQLERERQQRMQGGLRSNVNSGATKHRSADDIDDNFDLDDEPSYMVSYDKDGNPLLPDHILKEHSLKKEKVEFDNGISDSENETESESEDEGSDEDADEESEAVPDNEATDKITSSPDLKETKTVSNEGEDLKAAEKKEEVNDFKLPFTYEMPEEYEQLQELLSKYEPKEQSIVLERLIKCYRPSLAEENKEHLSKLFAFLLQYVNDIFSNVITENDVKRSFNTFDKIAPHMYDLAQHNVMNAKHCLSEVVVEKYEDYKKNAKVVPNLDTLIFFKLVSLIFPTSDFRHPVVTPCLVFMSEILSRCKFKNSVAIAKGLFVAALILEYTVLSKRFVPSAINFIRGILFYAANITLLNPIHLVPPFKLHSKEARILMLDEDCSKMAAGKQMAARDLVNEEVTAEFKIKCLCTSVNMLKEMFTNASELETQQCMFAPHIHLLSRMNLDWYPEEVRKEVKDTITFMKQCLEMKTYAPLAREKKRPKALRLYEPDVQDVFTGSKSSKLSREQVETNKLRHKLRRETKGALREIRRDKDYVGTVKLRQKIHSDNVRKAKVKEIFKDAAVQQAELNELKRRK